MMHYGYFLCLFLAGLWKSTVDAASKLHSSSLVWMMELYVEFYVKHHKKGRRTYRITARAQIPYLYHKPGVPYGAESFEGLLVDLLQRMSAILEVDFAFDHVGDITFGSKDGDSWSGMTGELIRNDSDLAVGPLTLTAVEAGVLEFTQPYVQHGYKILMQKPGTHDSLVKTHDVTLPIEPFTSGVWAVLISSFCALVFLHSLDIRYNKRNNYYRRRSLCSILVSAVYKTLTLSMGDTRTSSRASRVLRTSWTVFVCFVVILYATQLNVILMHRSHRTQEQLPFHSFQGLVSQTEVPYGSPIRTSYEYFKNSSQPLVQDIHKYLTLNNGYFDEPIWKQFETMKWKKGNYAVIVESDMAYYYASREPCNKFVIGETLGQKGHVFACRPGLEICSDLDSAISKLKLSGKLNNLLYTRLSGTCANYEDISSGYYYERKFGTRYDPEIPLQISLKTFVIPTSVFCFGIMSTLVIMIWEIKTSSVYKKRNYDADTLQKSWNIEMDNN